MDTQRQQQQPQAEQKYVDEMRAAAKGGQEEKVPGGGAEVPSMKGQQPTARHMQQGQQQKEAPIRGEHEQQGGANEEGQGGGKEGRQREIITDAGATEPLFRASHEHSEILTPDAAEAAALHVLDVTGALLLRLGHDEWQGRDARWLKQHIVQERNMDLGDRGEIVLYENFPNWIQDDVKLDQLKTRRVCFMRWVPHSGPFTLHFKLLPPTEHGRVVSVEVEGFNTVRELKYRLARQLGVSLMQQIMRCNGVVLQDDCTLEAYKIPPESTLELDIVRV